MTNPAPFAEIWRGPFLESVHSGHAVICDGTGQIVDAWGNPEAVILPRSSSKMIQALPLITSGAADKAGLTAEQLALSCASHQGAAIHTDRVAVWLETLGLSDDDFRCGPQEPSDTPAREALIRAHEKPCQIHNNCSGKHSGFLTLNQHLGGGADYVDPDHPIQRACLEAFETVTQETSPGYGIDGCSAPNYASTLHGMARAMAHFANAAEGSAEARLHQAMRLHPELVAGEGRACTELMRAMDGKVALKTGAEGFFIAILPEQKLGIALKAACGTTRAAECAIAALLVRLGVLDANHPATLKRLNAPIKNWRGIETGVLKPAAGLI
ncbi:asparaginase [Sulfitobacter mediterraneus]|uniref:asparaginase n=1 Tax=Sulfitobacter mediterraneus TaxID=83219 RepID=UPI00193AD48C|nr:asparaginase [Sulfitobacter mediterraneus]MBM1555255.1 asparaginase [Sulfitobacter mediterraneus]MBM1567192.1 asparaginase [Sulfitobacter mediterraneus]MBM1570994.1 asparaginase [Sulfitobacter mediterraneus]MBM1574794.1 asparaginase [Sulfitobacter mediterraneus]MBM1578213.1 asparaginase [Sulfitobacter mediterraneus]